MSFTNTKRMTAALLACLLILPASAGLSSCGTDTSQETQSASTADSATDAQESVAAADRCDLPEDLSFDNAEISFLYADTQGKNDELVSDGNSGLISATSWFGISSASSFPSCRARRTRLPPSWRTMLPPVSEATILWSTEPTVP